MLAHHCCSWHDSVSNRYCAGSECPLLSPPLPGQSGHQKSLSGSKRDLPLVMPCRLPLMTFLSFVCLEVVSSISCSITSSGMEGRPTGLSMNQNLTAENYELGDKASVPKPRQAGCVSCLRSLTIMIRLPTEIERRDFFVADTNLSHEMACFIHTCNCGKYFCNPLRTQKRKILDRILPKVESSHPSDCSG